jgi:hypothetical protein
MHGVEIRPFAAIGSGKATPSPTQLILKALFSEVKWQEHEADNLPPPNTEGLNPLTCTFMNYFCQRMHLISSLDGTKCSTSIQPYWNACHPTSCYEVQAFT